MTIYLQSNNITSDGLQYLAVALYNNKVEHIFYLSVS